MAGPSRTTPARPPPSLNKSTSSQSSKNQKTIMGFFQKKPTDVPTLEFNGLPKVNGAAIRGPSSSLTPAPSSDPPEEPESLRKATNQPNGLGAANGLPSPVTPANDTTNKEAAGANGLSHFNSPSRKVSHLPKQRQCFKLNQSIGEESHQLRRVWR